MWIPGLEGLNNSQRENTLIFYQIYSCNFFREIMENAYVGITL